MLILSRRRGEVIRIADDISIMVVRISGDVVRIGVQAPDDVVVDRDEVWHAKKRERDEQPEPPEPGNSP